MTEPVLLGTVAIEPNRWGTVHADRRPTVAVSEWLDQIEAAGFDGIELWAGHVTAADRTEAESIERHRLPVTVLNSYADLDDADHAERESVAGWVERLGATGVKCNVGNDPAQEAAYAERLAAWLDVLPQSTALLCECHQGISIAEEPAVAARILDAAGPSSRMQAIVHTHDHPDLLRAKFDAYGDRITHVHVNLLDFVTMDHPRLADVADRLASTVVLLRRLGFAGSWTIEFVAGLLGPDDQPARTVAQAGDDLRVLRPLLEAQSR